MNPNSAYFKDIMDDPANKIYTAQNWHPIYSINPQARILIIGQAPGKRVQETEIMWNDKSGDRLRNWMGISREIFYDSGEIAVIPMDFYYPGKASSGDVPPRKGIAEKWHPKLLATMPNIQLTILIGAYSQKLYLNLPASAKITDIVKNYQKFLPNYFPIVHPSPRNNIWLSRNPWFEQAVVPELQKQISKIMDKN
ncbi:uracil-DNA glycosylase family protein [Pediococcus claussenii]|uniref:Uracil-DNA glycosylase-like domain-containing protein n=1 Tax=Pediococcus claussenii (strain ATCC BAA-344 / DSM 14800 / JCM 18046 / KCTC 3811 / LMG 21948 / P06) TaxID=701521 RepID=G8PEA0_PEDCP|nr:uracil-DNA glycosylase family protein [Pediococcus claussenii]AEV94361.1 hypothetical protein PECL_23 [Pediococcus claussenii ATCC BAA-344]ANZ69583.1 uracil-DNA glycosylase [Pediococcus claussenii]ANZ71400.1 uracil-DNA glycosylase [Pediococcus claussenii]KRN19377.1 hypothetical protein IV79_GL001428 [Pediococcus claussenii]